MFDRDKKKLETKSASKDNRITPKTLPSSATKPPKNDWVQIYSNMDKASTCLMNGSSNIYLEVLPILVSTTRPNLQHKHFRSARNSPLYKYYKKLSDVLAKLDESLNDAKTSFNKEHIRKSLEDTKDNRSQQFQVLRASALKIAEIANEIESLVAEIRPMNQKVPAVIVEECCKKNSEKLTRHCTILLATINLLHTQLNKLTPNEQEAARGKKDEFGIGTSRLDELTLVSIECISDQNIPDFNALMQSLELEKSDSKSESEKDLASIQNLIKCQRALDMEKAEEAKQNLHSAKPSIPRKQKHEEQGDQELEDILKKFSFDKFEEDFHFTPLEDMRPNTPLPTRRAKTIEQQDLPSSAVSGASAKPTKPDRTKTTGGYEGSSSHR